MIKKQKVVVYAVRSNQLLVFRHVDFSYEEVGIQVPAGSVREGESFADAALRELKEETGFDCFEIVSEIGTDTYDMSPYRSELQERHFFLARTTTDLPERWDSQEDHDNEQEPTRFECFWIPLTQAHVLQSAQSVFISKLVAQHD
uniref:Nudix hydrolase domain-containing protein n=1 Tax=Candidatus Nitrotoga fabula TaxID=2182327 RepID=A0A2X0SHC9_9PROT|nr:conserved protein of unknown function [Candidatus Nitrotoga fabula]